MLLADGARLVKMFLHITPDEQLRRFRARLTDPVKRWKLSYEDFRNRGRWQEYQDAIEDMVEKTSSRHAPWHLIPANNKPFGRLAALRVIADRLSKGVSLSRVRSIPRSRKPRRKLLGIRLPAEKHTRGPSGGGRVYHALIGSRQDRGSRNPCSRIPIYSQAPLARSVRKQQAARTSWRSRRN